MTKILGKIAQGNMSAVYSAINEKTDKKYAIKKIIKEKEGMKQQLAAAPDVLKSLCHPNLPAIAGVSDNGDSAIIIMEYVEGTTLNKVIEERGAQAQDTVIEWAKQLCDVLCYLHSQQPPIVCGNMNPENIILKPDGKIILLDFCTLKDYKKQLAADVPCPEAFMYAAPEQSAVNRQIDERTDVYCLGATLYYLLTGCNPGKDPHERKPIRKINPAVSGGLEKIIIKSTQADPAARYQSAEQMLRALKRCSKQCDRPRTYQLFIESVIRRRRSASDAKPKKECESPPHGSAPQMGNYSPAMPSSPQMSNYSPAMPSMPSMPGALNNQMPDFPPGGPGEVTAFYDEAPAFYQKNNNSVSISQVSFSAVVPKRFIKGEYAMIEISVYEEMYRNIVDRIIANADTEVKEVVGGIQDVEQGTMIRIELSSSDIELSDCTETQRWSGKYLIFDFPVEVPNDYAKKQIRFTASVYFNNIIATRLKFIANCTSLREQKLELIREDVLTAFISYASQDRAEVATIIQGMKKIRPDLDVFFDVDNLRSGEYWETALKSEIEKRDILYLCWSKFAKESKWVEKEWRYALQNKGIDSIEPVSLISPSECPPPEELKSKHFNDKALLYKKI